jgi:bleomycin hydrolase
MLRDADRKDIQAVKEKGLSDIYRVLALNLGEPPTSFTWALKDKDGNIVDEKEYTPASFRDRFVRHDLENDYVILMDDPTRPYYKMYAVDNSRNCFELANWTFLNVPATELGAIGVESLKGGRMFYFSCDTAQDALMTEGIYDTDLYDLEGLLGVSFDMTKEELVRSCEIKSYHAMAMAGVEVDKEGKPVKWVVENSFGTVRGWDGFVVIDGEWFDRYMFRMAVERRFVPENLLPLLNQKPKLLKSWNPTY